MIKIAKTKIVTPRGIGINRGLTGCRRGHKTRTAVNEFINAGDIHNLMG